MPEATNSLGEVVQGTVVALAVDPDGPLAGVLLKGPSGCGKSDLALRLIDQCPWQRSRLVADDAVMIRQQGQHLTAICPASIENMIEIRGVGIMPIAAAGAVVLRAVLDLDAVPSRLPEVAVERLIAASRISLPVLPFNAEAPSAPVKLRYAVRAVLAGHFGAAGQDGALLKERRGNT